MSTAAGNTGRRCSTYRATVNPAIPSADCLSAERARFNDYNYAFSGFQGQPGENRHLQDSMLCDMRSASHMWF
jgi:hypothetical protein